MRERPAVLRSERLQLGLRSTGKNYPVNRRRSGRLYLHTLRTLIMSSSDSEDDEYVPDTKLGSASSSDSDDEREKPDAKRARIDAEPEEDLETHQG